MMSVDFFRKVFLPIHTKQEIIGTEAKKELIEYLNETLKSNINFLDVNNTQEMKSAITNKTSFICSSNFNHFFEFSSENGVYIFNFYTDSNIGSESHSIPFLSFAINPDSKKLDDFIYQLKSRENISFLDIFTIIPSVDGEIIHPSKSYNKKTSEINFFGYIKRYLKRRFNENFQDKKIKILSESIQNLLKYKNQLKDEEKKEAIKAIEDFSRFLAKCKLKKEKISTFKEFIKKEKSAFAIENMQNQDECQFTALTLPKLSTELWPNIQSTNAEELSYSIQEDNMQIFISLDTLSFSEKIEKLNEHLSNPQRAIFVEQEILKLNIVKPKPTLEDIDSLKKLLNNENCKYLSSICIEKICQLGQPKLIEDGKYFFENKFLPKEQKTSFQRYEHYTEIESFKYMFLPLLDKGVLSINILYSLGKILYPEATPNEIKNKKQDIIKTLENLKEDDKKEIHLLINAAKLMFLSKLRQSGNYSIKESEINFKELVFSSKIKKEDFFTKKQTHSTQIVAEISKSNSIKSTDKSRAIQKGIIQETSDKFISLLHFANNSIETFKELSEQEFFINNLFQVPYFQHNIEKEENYNYFIETIKRALEISNQTNNKETFVFFSKLYRLSQNFKNQKTEIDTLLDKESINYPELHYLKLLAITNQSPENLTKTASLSDILLILNSYKLHENSIKNDALYHIYYHNYKKAQNYLIAKAQNIHFTEILNSFLIKNNLNLPTGNWKQESEFTYIYEVNSKPFLAYNLKENKIHSLNASLTFIPEEIYEEHSSLFQYLNIQKKENIQLAITQDRITFKNKNTIYQIYRKEKLLSKVVNEKEYFLINDHETQESIKNSIPPVFNNFTLWCSLDKSELLLENPNNFRSYIYKNDQKIYSIKGELVKLIKIANFSEMAIQEGNHIDIIDYDIQINNNLLFNSNYKLENKAYYLFPALVFSNKENFKIIGKCFLECSKNKYISFTEKNDSIFPDNNFSALNLIYFFSQNNPDKANKLIEDHLTIEDLEEKTLSEKIITSKIPLEIKAKICHKLLTSELKDINANLYFDILSKYLEYENNIKSTLKLSYKELLECQIKLSEKNLSLDYKKIKNLEKTYLDKEHRQSNTRWNTKKTDISKILITQNGQFDTNIHKSSIKEISDLKNLLINLQIIPNEKFFVINLTTKELVSLYTINDFIKFSSRNDKNNFSVLHYNKTMHYDMNSCDKLSREIKNGKELLFIKNNQLIKAKTKLELEKSLTENCIWINNNELVTYKHANSFFNYNAPDFNKSISYLTNISLKQIKNYLLIKDLDNHGNKFLINNFKLYCFIYNLCKNIDNKSAKKELINFLNNENYTFSSLPKLEVSHLFLEKEVSLEQTNTPNKSQSEHQFLPEKESNPVINELISLSNKIAKDETLEYNLENLFKNFIPAKKESIKEHYQLSIKNSNIRCGILEKEILEIIYSHIEKEPNLFFQIEGNTSPRINIDFILETYFQGNFERLELPKNIVNEIEKKITDFLIVATKRQKASRILSCIDSDISQAGKEILLKRNFSIFNETNKKLLYLEYKLNLLLYEDKIEYIKKLLTTNDVNHCIEIMMGQGKSSILALISSWKKSILMFPENLLKTVKHNLSSDSKKLKSETPSQFKFNLGEDYSLEQLQSIHKSIKFAIRNNHSLISSNNDWGSLLLKLFTLLESKKLERSKIEEVCNILLLLKKEATVLIDEVDEINNPSKSLITVNKVSKQRNHFIINETLDFFLFIKDLLFKGQKLENYLFKETKVNIKKSYKDIKELITKELIYNKNSPLNYILENLSNAEKEEVAKYLFNKKYNLDLNKKLKQEINKVILYKEILTNYLLPCSELKYNINYGFNENSNLSVPFKWSNTPDKGCRHGNFLEEILLTIFANRQEILHINIFKKFIESVNSEKEKQLQSGLVTPSGETSADLHFYNITGLSLFNLKTEEDISSAYNALISHEKYQDYWNYIVRNNIFANTHEIEDSFKCDSSLLFNLFKSFDGMAGIIEDETILPEKKSSSSNHHYLQRVLKKKESENKLQLKVLSKVDEQNIISILSQNAFSNIHQYNIFIDIGALFNSFSSYETSIQLANILRGSKIKYVLFYENSELHALDCNSHEKIKIGAERNIKDLNCPLEQLFTYYDQPSTIGMNIQQHKDAKALVYISDTNTEREINQGIYRARKIASTQMLDFLLKEETIELLDTSIASNVEKIYALAKGNSTSDILDKKFKKGFQIINAYFANIILNRILVCDMKEKEALFKTFSYLFKHSSKLDLDSLIHQEKLCKANDILFSHLKTSFERFQQSLENLNDEIRSNLPKINDASVKNLKDKIKELNIPDDYKTFSRTHINSINVLSSQSISHKLQQKQKQTPKTKTKSSVQISESDKNRYLSVPLTSYIRDANSNLRYIIGFYCRPLKNESFNITEFDFNFKFNHINISSEFLYHDYDSSSYYPMKGTSKKPINFIMFHRENSRKVTATIIDDQTKEALVSRNIEGLWVESLSGLLCTGERNLNNIDNYEECLEQIYYLQGDIYSLIHRIDKFTWLTENTEDKLLYLKENILLNREDKESLCEILRKKINDNPSKELLKVGITMNNSNQKEKSFKELLQEKNINKAISFLDKATEKVSIKGINIKEIENIILIQKIIDKAELTLDDLSNLLIYAINKDNLQLFNQIKQRHNAVNIFYSTQENSASSISTIRLTPLQYAIIKKKTKIINELLNKEEINQFYSQIQEPKKYNEDLNLLEVHSCFLTLTDLETHLNNQDLRNNNTLIKTQNGYYKIQDDILYNITTENDLSSIFSENLISSDNPSYKLAIEAFNSTGFIKNGTTLHYAIKNTKIETALRLIELGENYNLLSDKKESAFSLLVASLERNNFEELISTLIEKEKEKSKSETTEEELSINSAIHLQNLKLAKLLIDNQVNMNIKDARNNSITPLMLSITHSKEIFDELLSSSNLDLDLQDSFGKTALIHSIEQKDKDKVIALINKKADINLQDSKGKTALIHAIESKQLEIATELISKEINLDLQDSDGKTALIHAVEHLPDVVSLLLEKKANLNIQDSNGKTAVMHAVHPRKDLALEAFDKVHEQIDYQILDNSNSSILHYLSINDMTNTTENHKLQTVCPNIINSSLEKNDVEQCDTANKMPLDYLLENNEIKSNAYFKDLTEKVLKKHKQRDEFVFIALSCIANLAMNTIYSKSLIGSLIIDCMTLYTCIKPDKNRKRSKIGKTLNSGKVSLIGFGLTVLVHRFTSKNSRIRRHTNNILGTFSGIGVVSDIFDMLQSTALNFEENKSKPRLIGFIQNNKITNVLALSFGFVNALKDRFKEKGYYPRHQKGFINKTKSILKTEKNRLLLFSGLLGYKFGGNKFIKGISSILIGFSSIKTIDKYSKARKKIF